MDEKKKIIYVDMDGVIADFEAGMAKIAPNLFLGEGDDYEHRSKMVDAICAENDLIFHDLPTIKGGIAAVKQLMKHYEVYFLSTPMWNVPESFTGKRIWIDKHFGKAAEKRLILTHRKDLNIGDYLIDDRTRNGAGEFTGEHIHFGTPKFASWDAVLLYLMPKDIQYEAKLSYYKDGARTFNVMATEPKGQQVPSVKPKYEWDNLTIDFDDDFLEQDFYNIYDSEFLLELDYAAPVCDTKIVAKAQIIRVRRYESHLSSVTLRISYMALLD